jgi:hypothetical protein
VSEALRFGKTAYRIEKDSREPRAADIGLEPLKYETILRHLKHVGTMAAVIPPPPSSPEAEVATSGAVEPVLLGGEAPAPVYEKAGSGTTTDIAELVAKRAADGIADGTLRVTTAHGLQAQAMIDRRLDKRRDRELAISLARMLGGGMAVPERLVVRNVTPLAVEGEYTPALEGDTSVEPS